MIIYFLLISILIGFSLIAPFLSFKTNKICAIFILFVFLMVISFKGDVGLDTVSYKKAFFVIDKLNTIEGLYAYYTIAGFEFGFYMITKIISLITSNFNMYMFILNCVSFTFLFKAVKKKSSNILLSICIYFIFFMLNYLNIWRQLLALNIALYGFSFLDLDIKKFFICVLVASTIHSIVFFMLSLLLIKKIQIKKFGLIVFSIIVLLIYFFAEPIFYFFVNNLPMFSMYSYYEIGKVSNFIPVIISLGLLLVMIYLYFLKNKNTEATFYLICQIICFVCILCSTKFFYIRRVEIIFSILVIFWLPSMINRKVNLNRVIILFSVILIHSVLLLNEASKLDNKYVPYEFVIWNNISIQIE